MSFREISAWITLVTVLGCFGVYFGSLATGEVAASSFDTLRLLLLCVLGLVVLQIGLHAVAAVHTSKASRARRDEREMLIQTRSRGIGYYVLMVAVLALAIPGHMGYSNIELLNFALLALVIAALAVAVSQIVMFRRSG
jgi:heme/copper-type cytochrome/quinol oxidase subunit 2